jgi:hypothetical protein
MRRWLTVALGSAALALGQDLRVRSEFQRPGPDGEVIRIDKVERPREILSPAVARNAYASYFLTISVPAGVDWYLEVGQNPENAARAVLYQVGHDTAGFPDELTKVEMPVKGRSEKPEVRSYWLDLWVDDGAPVRRIKVEPQVWVGDRWIVYPMEVRVQWATVPLFKPQFWGQPAVAARADAVMISPWRDYLCRQLPAQFKPEKATVRLLQHRNVLQDVALAKKMGVAAEGALKAGGVPLEKEAWCAAPAESWQKDLATEWYLRVRDFLYRNAVN